MKELLSVSYRETHPSRDHSFSGFFLSPDIHESWSSVMSICLFTEVKQQLAMLVIGWGTA